MPAELSSSPADLPGPGDRWSRPRAHRQRGRQPGEARSSERLDVAALVVGGDEQLGAGSRRRRRPGLERGADLRRRRGAEVGAAHEDDVADVVGRDRLCRGGIHARRCRPDHEELSKPLLERHREQGAVRATARGRRHARPQRGAAPSWTSRRRSGQPERRHRGDPRAPDDASGPCPHSQPPIAPHHLTAECVRPRTEGPAPTAWSGPVLDPALEGGGSLPSATPRRRGCLGVGPDSALRALGFHAVTL